MYWCFGQPSKRINHAVIPESSNPAIIPQTATAAAATVTTMAPDYLSSSSHTLLPFVAPPSSPASFLHTEPPSAVDSPVGLFSVTSSVSYPNSGNIIRPSSSIFVIGPYAHETQVVSPPAFTTEPSTAPFTPSPENGGVNQPLTTPPSPEVPFAKLLMSSWESSNTKKGDYGSEFHTYQLYPGSPIGTLISPNSVRSGTSSPLPDLDFHNSSFSPFPIASNTPSKHGSGYSRYSFQLTDEELEGKFLEKKPVEVVEDGSCHESPEKLVSGKEFKFDNADDETKEEGVGPDWWTGFGP